ncbi:MAG: hypothetical protein ACREM2_02990, partial [Vulcanimicrobiaceae bacterium]
RFGAYLIAGDSRAARQRLAAWLARRLALRLVLFDAAALERFDPDSQADVLAPLFDGVARIVLLESAESLGSSQLLGLIERRSPAILLLASGEREPAALHFADRFELAPGGRARRLGGALLRATHGPAR